MTEQEQPEKIVPSIIIAVDGSRPSYQAINYVLNMTRLVPDFKFVLLHVLPQIPPLFREEADMDSHILKKLKKLEATHQERGQEVLDKARQYLIEKQVAPDCVECRLVKRFSGVVKDIINQAEGGLFDALVVGRRGLTRTQEIFMGSVSSQLIQNATGIPLWIVDGEVSQPRVMIAVDGSVAGLRAVDHVAFMLSGHPEAELCFLHVLPRLQSDYPQDLGEVHEDDNNANDYSLSIEEDFLREDDLHFKDFLKKAVDILRQADFSQEQIKIEYREITLGIARTIISTAKEGGYGTIVLGRRGWGKSSFLGGVTDRVIRRVDDIAIWLVN